jgi:hypothetical protein
MDTVRSMLHCRVSKLPITFSCMLAISLFVPLTIIESSYPIASSKEVWISHWKAFVMAS